MNEPSHKSDVVLAEQMPLPTTPPPTEAPPTASKSSGSQPVQVAARPVTPVPVTWRSWPIVDSLGEFFFLTLTAGAAIGIAYRFAGPLTAVAAGIVLALVSWRYFVPTFFELSALGVSENCLGRKRRIPWISIDRYIVGRKGAYLSSTGAPLEMLRGLYLPWGPHREQIVATLRYYIPRAEDAAE